MRNQRKRGGNIDKGNLQKAVRTGLLLNRRSVDWTRFMLRQTDLARDIQQGIARFYSMATSAVSASQAQAGELIELMGHSIRAKAGLLQQASAAAQAPSLPESQTRWVDFWMAALRLAHSNADTLVRINGAAFDSWLRLTQNGR